ncbi:MAG: hypothetical protein ABGZ17_06600, partial [Planctomycetaceae bacterium]
MVELTAMEQALRRSVDRPSLIKRVFIESLKWPIPPELGDESEIGEVCGDARCAGLSGNAQHASGKIASFDLPKDCGW